MGVYFHNLHIVIYVCVYTRCTGLTIVLNYVNPNLKLHSQTWLGNGIKKNEWNCYLFALIIR